MNNRRANLVAVVYTLLALAGLMICWPFLWEVAPSLSYRRALTYTPAWRYLGTAIFLVILSLAGAIFFCSLAAHSIFRFKLAGRGFWFALMLGAMVAPPPFTVPPYTMTVCALGWYDCPLPSILRSFFAVLTFLFVFLLCQQLKAASRLLEDAAEIDGGGFWGSYWHITLPLCRPALAILMGLTFLTVWNYEIGSIFCGHWTWHGVPLGSAVLAVVSIMGTFFFAQRRFIAEKV